MRRGVHRRHLAAALAAAWVLAAAGPAAGQLARHYSRAEALELAFPDAGTVRPVPLSLRPEVREVIEREAKVDWEPRATECFQGVTRGRVTGYACIDNMVGRKRYITYLIRIEHPAGAIAFLEVMVYREQIGDMTHYPHFRRKFRGKTVDDWLWVGRDVPLVSGATLSCRALAAGARKIVHLYHHHLRHLPPP